MHLNLSMRYIAKFYQEKKKEIVTYAFIIILVWIAHFLLSNSFGFYEDDWEFSGVATTNSLLENLSRISYSVLTFWQGRPLHMIFLTLIPFYGNKVGGVSGIYFIGFILVSINAILFYSLLKKSIGQINVAIIAVSLFCVYPADTTFKFIQHLIGIQPALLFLLIAFHLFIIPPHNNKFTGIIRASSYLFAFLSILTYESLFLIFLTAPFFRQEPRNRKKYTYHFLITTSILGAYLILRKLAKEERIRDFSFTEKIQDLAYQLVFGPVISLGTFLLRPLQIMISLDLGEVAILIISTLLIFVILSQFLTQKIPFKEGAECIKKTISTFWIGVFMIFLAYPSALTLSVNVIEGRGSRVHFSAILGSTIIVACFWNILLIKAGEQKRVKSFVVLLISIHLSLLLLFSISIQKSYQLSWQYQQSFWSDVITLAPDMDKNTVILVQSPQLAWGKQVNPFDWSMPSVLKSIYDFPQGRNWSNEPRLYVVNSTSDDPEFWQEKIIKNREFILSTNSEGLRYYYPWEPEKKIDPSDLILLVEENGLLVRKSTLVLSDGALLNLKQKNGTSNVDGFSKTPLFYRLIPGEKNTKSSQGGAIYFYPQQ